MNNYQTISSFIHVHKRFIVVFGVLLFIMACPSVMFITEYDEQIDRSATELQTRIETFLIKMERVAGTPEGEYRNNEDFYDEVLGTLNAMRERALAVDEEKNKQTLGIIDTIEDYVVCRLFWHM